MDIEKEARKYLPLTEATFYIMISLHHALHGYGIMQNVTDISGGSVKLGPGTLYGVLSKLQKEKLIVPSDLAEAQDERRKSYMLTILGKKVVRLEYQRLKALISNVDKMIGNLEDY